MSTDACGKVGPDIQHQEENYRSDQTCEILLDAELCPDSDAELELGPEPSAEAITDEETKGTRILIVLNQVTAVTVENSTRSKLSYTCSFQPPQGARVIWARLVFKFDSPAGVKIIDISPRVESETSVSENRSSTMTAAVEQQPLKLEASKTVERQFDVPHIQVQGTGVATNLARWDFNENPSIRNGVPRESILSTTLSGLGKVGADVVFSARICRSSLSGLVDRVRDMILKPREKNYLIEIDIPESEAKASSPQ